LVSISLPAVACQGTQLASPLSCWGTTVSEGNQEVVLSAGTIVTIAKQLEDENFDGKEKLVVELDRIQSALRRWTSSEHDPAVAITFPANNGDCFYKHQSGNSQKFLPLDSCIEIKANLGWRLALLADKLIEASVEGFNGTISSHQHAFLLTNLTFSSSPNLPLIAEQIAKADTFLTDEKQSQLFNLVSDIRNQNDQYAVRAQPFPNDGTALGVVEIMGTTLSIHSQSGEYFGYYNEAKWRNILLEDDVRSWNEYSKGWSNAAGVADGVGMVAMEEWAPMVTELSQLNQDNEVVQLDLSKPWFLNSFVQYQLWNGQLPYSLDNTYLLE